MKLRVFNPFSLLLFTVLLSQAVPTSCSMEGISGGPGYGSLTLDPTSLAFSQFSQTQNVSVSQINYSGAFTVDASNCAGIAAIGASPLYGPSDTLAVTSSAATNGNCTIYITGGGGAQNSLPVSVSASGSATPTPAPGPLTFTPSSLTFAYPGATSQNVTMTDPNNSNSIVASPLPSPDIHTCYNGATAIWKIGDGFGSGASATRGVSPLGAGTCALTLIDGNGNSASITATIGTPTPTPTTPPTASPTGSISQVYLEWGDAPANFNQTCLPTCSQLTAISPNTGYVVNPSSWPLVQFVTKPTSMTYEITDLDNTNYDTGVCNTSSGCSGGTSIGTFGGKSYYGLQVSSYGVSTGWALQIINKIPCHRYMLYLTSPQVATYGPFQAPAVADAGNGNPTPGNCVSAPNAAPLAIPTPAIGSNFQLNAWATPAPMETPVPCSVSWTAQENASCHFGVLEHIQNNSLGDTTGSGCRAPTGTCTLTTGAQQMVNYLGGVGMGHAKLEFEANNIWGNQSSNPQYYATPVWNAYDAITTALHAVGVELGVHCESMSTPNYMGSNASSTIFYTSYWYGHFCGQVAAHEVATFPTVHLYYTSNEPNTSFTHQLVQMALTGSVSAGATTVTVGPLSASPWNYNAINFGNATLSCTGSPLLIFGDDNFATTSPYLPDEPPCSAVTNNGNGTYTFTLSTPLTFSHSSGAIVGCCMKGAGGTAVTDTSGANYAAYLLYAYQQIHTADSLAKVVGPELNGGQAGFGGTYLKSLVQHGCKTGTCWDILSAHLSPNFDVNAPHGAGASGEDFALRDALYPILAQNGDTLHPLLANSEFRRLPGMPANKAPNSAWNTYSAVYQGYEDALDIDAMMSDTQQPNYVGGPQITIMDITDVCSQCLPSGYNGGGQCSPFQGYPESTVVNNGNINVFDGFIYQGYSANSCVATAAQYIPSGWNATPAGWNASWMQVPKPAWSDLRAMYCGYASPPSCTGGTISMLTPLGKAVAVQQMHAYEAQGDLAMAGRISGMLLQASGLTIAAAY